MDKGRLSRRLLMLALAGILAFGGCGVKKGQQAGADRDGNDGSTGEDLVWVPEYVSLGGKGIGYDNIAVDDDTLYFVKESLDEESGSPRRVIAAIALSDGSEGREVAPEGWGSDAADGADRRCAALFRTAEGGFATLEGVYPKEADERTGPGEYYFCRYDAEGRKQEERDLSDKMAAEGKGALLWEAAMDGMGRFYFAMQDGRIHLADAEGSYCGEILPGGEDNWIPAICAGKNGRVYIVQYEYSANSGEYVIKELDFEEKAVGAVCRNYPGYPGDFTGIGMASGAEQELMVYDGVSLYGYEVRNQSSVKLFDWADGGVNGESVIRVHAMRDGRILAIRREPGGGDMEMTFFSPKKSTEAVEKETVTLACFQKNRQLEKTVAEFNRQSDRFHVVVKVYFKDGLASEVQDRFADATLRFNADLVSDHSPDLLLLSHYDFNTEQLAANGMFEDLEPWLAASDRYSREDFFPNVLEVGTYNGVLVTIPKDFSVAFLAGKAKDLGTEPGWTMEEMIAYADAHPDAQLLNRSTKRTFLESMIINGMDNYVDWAGGECHFDSDEFVRLLELADRFPLEFPPWSEDEDATFYKLQDGRVLLYGGLYSDFFGVQVTRMLFSGEEINYIGYPGGQGIHLGTGTKIAMLAGSAHKDGAWAFLEYYLDSEDEWPYSDFSSVKKKFEAAMEEAMGGLRHRVDEGGNPVTTAQELKWSVELHSPDREEMEVLQNLIEAAVPVKKANHQMCKIVTEEAEAYFQGQKSAEDVAGVIQSRIRIYMNENR